MPFQNVPVKAQFSKSTVFKMLTKDVPSSCKGRPIHHIVHRFQNVTVAKFELAFIRYRNNWKMVGNLTVKNSLQDFDAKEMYLHSKNRSVSFPRH